MLKQINLAFTKDLEIPTANYKSFTLIRQIVFLRLNIKTIFLIIEYFIILINISVKMQYSKNGN